MSFNIPRLEETAAICMLFAQRAAEEKDHEKALENIKDVWVLAETMSDDHKQSLRLWCLVQTTTLSMQ